VYKNNGAIVIGWHPSHPVIIIYSDEFGLCSCLPCDLSKPETPAEREETERLEAAYYLYCKCGIQHETVSFEKFKAGDDCYPEVWLDIVKETGYRKEASK
jgi:hypothetical protein